MPRPLGYKLPPEERAAVSEGMRRWWAERKPWTEAVRAIRAAVDNGDRDKATELLHEFMDRQEEKEPA